MSYFGDKTPITGLNSVSIVERTPVVELKSTYGISALRDITTVAGTGAVTNTGSEYLLSTGTTTASSAALDSAERGRYQPGAEAECGIGVRFTSTAYTGTAEARWGYFDTEDGFGFGVDATSPFVFTRKGSTNTDVAQANWNRDTMDGNGPSGLTLDLEEGNIFQIDFTWYGYGVIQFKVVVPDANGSQVIIVVHEFSPSQATSVADPNLPIAAVVNNGNTTTDYDVYVGGRQFSVLGRYSPNRRINGEYRLSRTPVSTTFLPLISFRLKSAFDSVSVKIDGMDIISDEDLIWEIRTGLVVGDLTSESFGTPQLVTAAETAVETDIAATAMTGNAGEFIDGGLLGASGVGSSAAGALSIGDLIFDVPETHIVTLAVRCVTATNATVSAFLRWREEW